MPTSANDGSLERAVWLLAAAVTALVIREAWQVWVSHKDRKRRDKLLLSTALREVNVMLGLATSIKTALEKDAHLLLTNSDWSTKPLVQLPDQIYEMFGNEIPSALLAQSNAIVDLIRLQHQAAWTNYLGEVQMTWKGPLGAGHANRADMIAAYGMMLEESIGHVLERGSKVATALREAGVAVGGLNLANE